MIEPYALSVPEAMKALGGIGRTHLYSMLASGALEGFKNGSRTFITTESIKAYIASAPRLSEAA